MTNFGWQSISGQGYNLYPNGTIGPKSSEAINIGKNYYSGSNDLTKMKLIHKPTKGPDIWNGGFINYGNNMVQMDYGTVSKGNLPYVSEQWRGAVAKGMHDTNRSVFPSVMADTYINPKTGEHLNELLNPNFKGTVEGVKRANTGVAFFEEGTMILDSERQLLGQAPRAVQPFEPVLMDAAGCYKSNAKTYLGKYIPTTAEGAVERTLFQDAFNASKSAPESASSLYAGFLKDSKEAVGLIEGTEKADKASRIMQQAVEYVKEGESVDLAKRTSDRIGKIMLKHAENAKAAAHAGEVAQVAEASTEVAQTAEKATSFLGKIKDVVSNNKGTVALALAGVVALGASALYIINQNKQKEIA